MMTAAPLLHPYARAVRDRDYRQALGVLWSTTAYRHNWFVDEGGDTSPWCVLVRGLRASLQTEEGRADIAHWSARRPHPGLWDNELDQDMLEFGAQRCAHAFALLQSARLLADATEGPVRPPQLEAARRRLLQFSRNSNQAGIVGWAMPRLEDYVALLASDRRQRRARADVTVNGMVVIDGSGSLTELRLSMAAPGDAGAGRLIPALGEERVHVRSKSFHKSEVNARLAAGLDKARFDVQWSLRSFPDNRSTDRLDGGSLGLALAVGLKKLLATA